MDGVKRVVELRGGIGMLPQSVQDKIHRLVMVSITLPAKFNF